MSKKILILTLMLTALMLAPVFAVGHINGCTNTDFSTNCCTKTFSIVPKAGYKIVSLIVNGISQTITAEQQTGMTYTFTDITEAKTLEVIAEPIVNNSAPEIPTVSVSSKTTSSVTVSAVATDVDGDNLVYMLYVKQASESAYSLKAASTSTTAGTQVSLTASGLSEYTDYSYYVTVTDGKETSTSSTGNVKTYCSGTGTTRYTAPSCTRNSCGTCSGTGTTICDGYDNGNDIGNFSCDRCDYKNGYGGYYVCPKCGFCWCVSCYTELDYSWMDSDHSIECPTCEGSGKSSCTKHGLSDYHYNCQHCNDTYYHSHNTCSHGYISQH